ncbi:piercer of microtubule wall 2 protein [Pleurodeles waltl]|uniref:piercer of microtubule wall 2 protein n=1 Tax=Pleurodeles waltl TaxID=8319 RepID=UPI0037097283
MTSCERSSTTSSSKKKESDELFLGVNPGNPIFSCMMPPSDSSNSLGAKPQSILFKTTSGQYGALTPTYEMSPCVYYPMTQYFSDELGKCGMYRNHSLNTALDRSKVYDYPNFQNTL